MIAQYHKSIEMIFNVSYAPLSFVDAFTKNHQNNLK